MSGNKLMAESRRSILVIEDQTNEETAYRLRIDKAQVRKAIGMIRMKSQLAICKRDRQKNSLDP